MNACKYIFSLKGSARSLEIYTHVLASLGHRYYDLRKNMGTLCLYHSRTDVYEDGVRIQYTSGTYSLFEENS